MSNEMYFIDGKRKNIYNFMLVAHGKFLGILYSVVRNDFQYRLILYIHVC